MTNPWPLQKHAPQLGADELHVWLVPLAVERAQWDVCWTRISDEERTRAQQFQLDEPRRRLVMARAALRPLLGHYLDVAPEEVRLEFGAHGKPRLAPRHAVRELSFNIAHSGDFALIAVATGCEVGVDIERLRGVNQAAHIAARYFHEREIATILAAVSTDRDKTFLRCWTGKEAVLKALGSGVTGSLADFLVPAEPYDSTWIDLPPSTSREHRRCWLHSLEPCHGYLGAVACLDAERDVQCFVFDV